MKKVGIFGGAFDPIHRGHLQMAIVACNSAKLDEMWLIPSGHSPNKNESDMEEGRHRYRMCELAAMADERLTASPIEMESAEQSYTYRTLERISERLPNTRLYFLMGGDSLDYFEQWKKPERICELATILVAERNAFDSPALARKASQLRELFACNIQMVPFAPVALSSTQLREQLAEGVADSADFPPGVFDYNQTDGLYRHKTAQKAGKE